MTSRHVNRRDSALTLAGIVLMCLAFAGCGVASAGAPGSPSADGGTSGPATGATTAEPFIPITGSTASSGVIGSIGAYPVPAYPGLPGLALDHTIVVTSTSQATVRSDLSNVVTAQHAALTAALLDARAQADIVASATGSAISGVLSVTVSTSQNLPGPVPAGAVANPAPSRAGTSSIQPPPSFGIVAVTVTVAYWIG